MKFHIVIIGGGITGILSALRLSKDKVLDNNEILLIDSHDSLGGRFFFSNSFPDSKSGFGFEGESLNELDTLKRHLFLYLTEEEKNFVDNFIHEKTRAYPFHILNPKKYFVKKEILNAHYLLLSNSEFLTKKDAEILHSIVYFNKDNSFENEKETSLENSQLWINLNKSSKENLLTILEFLLGQNGLKLPLNLVAEKLKHVFDEEITYNDPFFLRTFEIELAFQHILKTRNVQMHFKCTLKSIEKNDHNYHLMTMDSDKNVKISSLIDKEDISAHKVILTIPPYHIRNLFHKKYFSSELARFVSKVQPTSLLCLEIYDFQNKLSENMHNKFQTLDRLYFPVEGVNAFVTSDARLVFFDELDYETSLQAPAVRESLTHLRRAARRVLKEEFSAELKKGSFMRKSDPFERIILLPIAQNLSPHIQILELPELKDVKFSIPNIYAVGDYFYSLGDTRWKRIVKSVEKMIQEFF